MGIGVGDDAEAKRNRVGPAAGYKGLLPEGWQKPKRLMGELMVRHPALVGLFGRGVGGTLMFRESTVMVTLLDELMSEGIVALPLHDGVTVSRSSAAAAKAAMERVALRVTGLRFPVEEKA